MNKKQILLTLLLSGTLAGCSGQKTATDSGAQDSTDLVVKVVSETGIENIDIVTRQYAFLGEMPDSTRSMFKTRYSFLPITYDLEEIDSLINPGYEVTMRVPRTTIPLSHYDFSLPQIIKVKRQ